jgi:hypothetical protein
MTSEPTRQRTEQYFAENNYFGLNAANVTFFNQGTMPCVDFEGRIFLETRSSISRAPGQSLISSGLISIRVSITFQVARLFIERRRDI